MSWQLASLLILGLVLLAGFAWYERERPTARVLALVAALAALAVVGRLAFAALPNVKPTTDIVLFAGYALGAVPGFAVGAITALVSNIFLSQGPWTAWQMVGWGGVGAGAALLARFLRGRELGRLPLALVCGAAGLAFGAWMDVYQWTLAARQDVDSYVAVSASSLPYNLAHAIGNVVFCLLIGPAFVRALGRYRRRLEVHWEKPAIATGAAAAVLAVAIAAGAGAGGGGEAVAATRAPAGTAGVSPVSRAVRYLLRAQNRDGGFGAAPGVGSNHLQTGWAGLGLAAAGRNARDVRRRGGRSVTSFVTRKAGSLRDIGEVERTVMLLASAGLSPRRFAGRDLVGLIKARRRGDGSIAGYVSYTAFGIMALRAVGERPPGGSVAYLRRAQNGDGGFGVAASSASDTDMTGMVMQALAAAGRLGGGVESRAVAYLRQSQNGDGGFGAFQGRSSNAQSTAYAVQGLVAAGSAARAVARGLRYLRGLQARDGSVRYSRASAQTPVWVTSQALLALTRKPFPLRRVPRRRTMGKSAAQPARTGGGGSRRDARRKRGRDTGERASARAEQGEQSPLASVAGLRRASDGAGAGAKRVAAEPASEAPPAWLIGLVCAASLVAVAL
ncbi:MAG TPA: prenyltransferase/squalene oxidase repeat-containing protein, partial [Thermoleophilaceae bacterium]|nr:prenyltransferase/squalene oxidase repeat-containing protein [Thermoleophilaceae bacterium]